MKNIKSYTESLSKEGIQKELNHDMRNAARMGKIRNVKRLLGEGADVNSTGGLGKTALHEATFWGYRNIVKLLIDSGADVNARKSLGETPLHRATTRILPLKHNEEKPEIVKLLIDAGAQIDARDVDGKTPLMLALENLPPAFEYYHEIPKTLIIGGADPLKAFKGPAEILDFFKGDIDWWPEGDLRTKLKRMVRGKQAFGM